MPSKNEVVLLQQDITQEVSRDAEVIAAQLFGGNAQNREPDLARVSFSDLQNLYRQKYLDNDRSWLQQESRRDPQQFTRVARSIGVVLPGEVPEFGNSPAQLPQGWGVSALTPQPAPVQPAQPMLPPQPPTPPPNVNIITGGPPQAPLMPPVAAPVQPPGPQPVIGLPPGQV